MTSKLFVSLTGGMAAIVLAASIAVAQPDMQPPPVDTPVPAPVEVPAPDAGSQPPVESSPFPPSETPFEQPSTPPPPEIVVPAPPTGPAPVAVGVVLGGIDKVAARTAKFDANLKTKVFYNTLIITAYACKTRPPEEPPESAAFLQIQERKPDGTTQQLFSGWMFASSPALNALEHPVYDVWVISCKTAPAANTSPVPPNS